MSRGWDDRTAPAGRRRLSLRPVRPGGDDGDRVRRTLEGNEAALAEVLVRTLVSGCGLLLTTTRDGGAVGVHLYQGETRASDFVSSSEELEAVIQAIHERLDTKRPGGAFPRPLASGERS